MKIVVLAGGLSPERDVSLCSGALIANALMKNGHQVMLLDLFWGRANREIEAIYHDGESGFAFDYKIPEIEPDLAALQMARGGESLIGEGVVELCQEADKVFMALHGGIGENGQLQALFDIYGVKYTGSGYEGSLLAMDKDLAKRMMRAAGILTADWGYYNLAEENDWESVKYPAVVKPNGCGSSVGVSMVENRAELEKALAEVEKYEQGVVIEDKIVGREFSVGIIAGEALPVIEIMPHEGFYDYKNKYQAGRADEVCPAQISEEWREKLQAGAVAVGKALRLGFYARIDFIVNEVGEAYCLEANTLPGMTPTSLLPQEAAEMGIDYGRLCEMIVEGKK